jgi:23S rRNA pseudouridine2604 synthase
MDDFPMRINKYLALNNYATRRGADELIEKGMVQINGVRAKLGDKVVRSDKVTVRQPKRAYRYYAYNKPRHIITHSPQGEEKGISDVVDLEGVFPVGRLDKDSYGLIILTNDGRVTDRLLNPKFEHEKEYRVKTAINLRPSFPVHMEKGVDIGGYVTKKCKVKVLGERQFSITLSEGKKHQIRRMCAAMHTDAVELQRVRIMHVRLGNLKAGEYRPLEGTELAQFLADLGLTDESPQT